MLTIGQTTDKCLLYFSHLTLNHLHTNNYIKWKMCLLASSLNYYKRFDFTSNCTVKNPATEECTGKENAVETVMLLLCRYKFIYHSRVFPYYFRTFRRNNMFR